MKQYTNFIRAVMLLLITTVTSQAQSIVSGTVLDGDTKESLPGTNISIKGRTEGSFTTSDGSFSIQVKQFPATLVFSFIGFETKELKVTGPQSNIIIELVSGAMLMQEVVV